LQRCCGPLQRSLLARRCGRSEGSEHAVAVSRCYVWDDLDRKGPFSSAPPKSHCPRGRARRRMRRATGAKGGGGSGGCGCGRRAGRAARARVRLARRGLPRAGAAPGRRAAREQTHKTAHRVRARMPSLRGGRAEEGGTRVLTGGRKRPIGARRIGARAAGARGVGALLRVPEYSADGTRHSGPHRVLAAGRPQPSSRRRLSSSLARAFVPSARPFKPPFRFQGTHTPTHTNPRMHTHTHTYTHTHAHAHTHTRTQTTQPHTHTHIHTHTHAAQMCCRSIGSAV
jgi:hypothetical protein